jgi:hypothetical protein
LGELLGVFLDAAGLKNVVKIETDTTRIDLIPRHVASISRLAAEGFARQYSLERSCREMLTYCARYLYDA